MSEHKYTSNAFRRRDQGNSQNNSLLQDKKKNFEKQRSKMQKRNSSFLDSIRMEVENEEDF